MGECRAFRNLGDAFKAQGMIERAVQSYRKHVEHVESFEDPEAQAMAYDVLGKAYHRFGNDCSLVPAQTANQTTTMKVKDAPQFDRAAKFFRERLDGTRLLGRSKAPLSNR